MAGTTRQQLAEALRVAPHTASELADIVDVPAPQIYEHLEHVARSVGDDEEFLVAPPECADCGFAGFDDPLNYPSRCPDCKSERIEEPVFTIE